MISHILGVSQEGRCMVLQKLDEASVVLGISPPLLHPPANTFSPGGRKKCSLIGMLDTLPATLPVSGSPQLPGVEGILVKQLGQYARFLEYGLWFMDVQPVVYNPGG